MKSNLYRLPIIGYEPHRDNNTEMAFVIPVFARARRKLSTSSIIGEYVNAAIAAGRSLVINTNVVNNHIPIFYLIEDTVYSKWKYRFLNAGIKPDRLLAFSALHSSVKTRGMSKKLYALDQLVPKRYDCYLVMDADLFVCCDPAIGDKFDVMLFFGAPIGALWHGRAKHHSSNLFKNGA